MIKFTPEEVWQLGGLRSSQGFRATDLYSILNSRQILIIQSNCLMNIQSEES